MGEDVESFRMSSDQRDYASSRKGACWGASGISCPHTQSGPPRFCTMTQFLHSTVGLQWFRNYSGWYTSKDSEDQRNLSAHRTRQNTRFTWSSDPQSYRNHTAMILSWKFIFKNMDISSWGLKRLAIRAQFKKPAYLMVQCRISIASVSQMCTLPVQWAVCTPGKTL